MSLFKSILIPILISVSLGACTTTSVKRSYNDFTLDNLIEERGSESQDRALLSITSIKRAENDLQAGRIKSALKYAKLATQFDPDDINAKTVLGKVEIANKNYVAGSIHFEEIVQTNPNAENFQFLGISHYYLGNIKASKFALMQAIEMDSALWLSSILLARIENKNGNISRADKLFASSLSQSKTPQVVYEHMGQAYVERKDWAKALPAFKAAQALSANAIGNHDQYRLAMAKTGHLNTVLKSGHSEDIARLYRNLGEDALQNGNKFKAVEYLKKAQDKFSRLDTKTDQLLQNAINLPG